MGMIWPISMALLTLTPAFADEHERRLYARLLNGYNTLERPVINNSLPVEVQLQIVLNQIIDVDEKNQIVQTNIWLKYVWHDFHLQWNPVEFGGVADVRIPMGSIWRPDILLYNSVDQDFDTTFGVNHVVYNNGEINWLPPGIVKSSCTIDITWFPFDEQTCHFKFSSWTYGEFKLNLSQLDTGWDVSEYIENGEWLLIKHYVERQVTRYECCPDPYINLYFYFVIRRRTLYYGFNMILPSLIVSLMTLLGFALPVESGEKVTLEITILLSVCVFLGMVASMTPPTSEALPLMRNLMLNLLPWLLMMKRPGHKFTRKTIYKATKSPSKGERSLINGEGSETNKRSSRDSTVLGFVTPAKSSAISSPMEEPPIGRIRRLYSSDFDSRILQCLQNLSKNPNTDQMTLSVLLAVQQVQADVKFIAKRMAREDEVQEAKNDWRFAAMVVDRLCLVLFTVVIVVSTCAIFFSAPYIVA